MHKGEWKLYYDDISKSKYLEISEIAKKSFKL